MVINSIFTFLWPSKCAFHKNDGNYLSFDEIVFFSFVDHLHFHTGIAFLHEITWFLVKHSSHFSMSLNQSHNNNSIEMQAKIYIKKKKHSMIHNWINWPLKNKHKQFISDWIVSSFTFYSITNGICRDLKQMYHRFFLLIAECANAQCLRTVGTMSVSDIIELELENSFSFSHIDCCPTENTLTHFSIYSKRMYRRLKHQFTHSNHTHRKFTWSVVTHSFIDWTSFS